MNGEGEFSRSLALTGEAHLAVLALVPVRVAGLWLVIQSNADPTELPAQIGFGITFWGTVPLAVISVLGILWKGAIVGFGLTELDTKRGVAVGGRHRRRHLAGHALVRRRYHVRGGGERGLHRPRDRSLP